MFSHVLTVDTRPDPELERVVVNAPLADYVTRLERNGYSEIRLLGLSRVAAKCADGTTTDEFTASVDSDAHFLLSYYARLEELVELSASALHRVYVVDGCVEFSAFVAPLRTFVRVGVFRENPFQAPWADGVELATETYLAMWRSIAAAISAGSRPR